MSTVSVTVEFGSPYEAQLGLALLSMLKYAEGPYDDLNKGRDRSLALFPDALASIVSLLKDELDQADWSSLPWTHEQCERIRQYFQIESPWK